MILNLEYGLWHMQNNMQESASGTILRSWTEKKIAEEQWKNKEEAVWLILL